MHPGGRDVVGVAEPSDGRAVDRPLLLLEGHDVGHDLAGMRQVGEPVDHRHGGVRGKLEQLARASRCAEHDRIDVARQHAGGVGDGLAPADLHVGRAQA